MQTTIATTVQTAGTGLHTGCDVSVKLRPAPADTGVVFRRVDLQNYPIEANRQWVSRVMLATTLMKRGVMLSTVEHLLSAVYGFGIDNLFIDIDSLEVPILDGSSLPFIELLQKAGVREQDAPRRYLLVEEPVILRDGEKWIAVEPASGFSICYDIDFAHPAIGVQSLDLEISRESYLREIAFARTFGFYNEVEELRKKGLIRGGSLDNAVVIGDEGILNGPLRTPDEFVRHKVLDLIGDISLCGRPLVGRIRAYKAGHSLHTSLATEVWRNRSAVREVLESELLEADLAVNH